MKAVATSEFQRQPAGTVDEGDPPARSGKQAKAPARLPLRLLLLLERDSLRGLLLPAAENPEDFGPSWPEVRGLSCGRPGADPCRACSHPKAGKKVVRQL